MNQLKQQIDVGSLLLKASGLVPRVSLFLTSLIHIRSFFLIPFEARVERLLVFINKNPKNKTKNALKLVTFLNLVGYWLWTTNELTRRFLCTSHKSEPFQHLNVSQDLISRGQISPTHLPLAAWCSLPTPPVVLFCHSASSQSHCEPRFECYGKHRWWVQFPHGRWL